MVSCHFSVCHFTLIHSHKPSNRIYLLHDLNLFIYSLSYTHPFSAEDWLLGRTFMSELRKTRACQNTSSVCCNRPYVRIHWNVIQLFMLNELVNGEIPCFNCQYPALTVRCALFKLKCFTNYAYSRDLHSVLPRIFASRNSISSAV